MEGEDDEGGDDALGSCKVERRGLPALRICCQRELQKVLSGFWNGSMGLKALLSRPNRSR